MSANATRARLWRYNYRILIGGGYWIIVLPIAASQIVTLWMFALAADFTQPAAVQIAELMTPILGAFLVAHSMAPEYRSGIGTVLACKPVSLHRVVTMRVGIAFLSATALTLISLGICSVGLKPLDLTPPILAALPPLWFLSMVALTAATLFRSALAGFAIAAAIWVLDFTLGYGVNPFLSARGFSAVADQDPLAGLWVYGKVTLLVLGTALLFLHGRILPRICRAPERRDMLRIVAVVASVVVLYVITGAGSAVAYAYANRSNLTTPDVTWLRRQMRLYGPLPARQLFGPAFNAYVAEPAGMEEGKAERSSRATQLESALSRWPKSMWADGIAFALAIERESVDEAAATEAYLAVADRYGSSPFARKSLVRIVRSSSDSIPVQLKLTAARRLKADYPHTPEAGRAAETVADLYPGSIQGEEALGFADIGHEQGPRYLRPQWLAFKAGVLADLNRNEEAVSVAREARKLALELQAQAIKNAGNFDDLSTNRTRIDSALQTAEALLKRLGASP